MAMGYAGKILFVDLSTGKLKEEALEEQFCRKFIGGYGIGARIIYSQQRGGVDPLGPENMLGFMTSPLTGTAMCSPRFGVMGKSPLTGTWGDSNSGGHFGPYLKFAGYDGVFFMGVSEKPVYLFVKDGKAELNDATHLWGKDTDETEDMLRNELGENVKIASIGPGGEKASLIACIITDKGRAAGRSGLGAVMGSKKLKALAVSGTAKIPVADPDGLKRLRKKYMDYLKAPGAVSLSRYGWSQTPAAMAHSGALPTKNWGGVGARDFPEPDPISGDNVIALDEKRYGCYGCPVSCGGIMKAGKEYKYKAGAHRPEMESMAAFGNLCLNNNLESLIMANDICNRYGIDTISTGTIIAFAMECYENGIISRGDTEGIELTWGNHKAIVEMTERIAKREGFGAVLADGVKVAAERIGKGADKYAIHVHGQELPMWDPRFIPSMANNYVSDPTPGRHTQQGMGFREAGVIPPEFELPKFDRYTYTGKGKYEAIFRNANQFQNAAGGCMNVSLALLPFDVWVNYVSVVTGWQLSPEEANVIGERISALRQAFNLREGLSPKDFNIPGRVIGDPPLTEGPTANITVDVNTLVKEYFQAMDWDPDTGKPSKKKLLELGLEDVAEDLWP